MQKRAPTLANILVIVLFALSCFGLLLFLWDSFGGPVPLKPKGYRFSVELSRTLALAEESDVRISRRGRRPCDQPGDARQRDDRRDHGNGPSVRPDPSNDHLILRQKTLLGETYVELFPPGTPGGHGGSGGQAQEQSSGGRVVRTRPWEAATRSPTAGSWPRARSTPR